MNEYGTPLFDENAIRSLSPTSTACSNKGRLHGSQEGVGEAEGGNKAAKK